MLGPINQPVPGFVSEAWFGLLAPAGTPDVVVARINAAVQKVMADDGIYLVGTDIKPGTYRNGPEGDCYWARLRNTNGDLDSIIANNNGGNQVVTIKRTDKAFETSNCGTWRKVG